MSRTTLVLAALVLSGVSTADAEEYTPSYDRIRAALRSGRRDSVWDGALIGAAAGAGGGYLWARNICGSNDAECFAIAGPVGVLSGAGIGAAVGAIVDALHR